MNMVVTPRIYFVHPAQMISRASITGSWFKEKISEKTNKLPIHYGVAIFQTFYLN